MTSVQQAENDLLDAMGLGRIEDKDLEIAELLAKKIADIDVYSGTNSNSYRFLKAFTDDELMLVRKWIWEKQKRR